MKEEAKHEQNIIQSILDQKSELLKLNNSLVNNSISQYVENGSRNNEKNLKNSSSQISEKLDITNDVIWLKRWRSWSKKLKKMMVQQT